MKKLFKKLIICSLFCAFISVPVNAASVKAQAEKPVKMFYKYAKVLNKTKMWKYANPNKDSSDSSSVSDKSFNKVASIIKKENRKCLKIKIIKTTISKNNKSAKIKVRVKYRSLYKASYNSVMDTFAYAIKYYMAHGKVPSDKKSEDLIVKSYIKNVKKKPSKLKTRTITITTKKYKNGWRIVKITNPLADTYSCDFVSGMNDASNKIDSEF